MSEGRIERFWKRPLKDWPVLTLSLVVLAARITLGLVFVVASVHKFMDPQCFAELIKNYDMVPYPLLGPFALLLSWLELWTGLFLIFGFWTRPSTFLIQGMLVVFMIALGYAVARGLDIECGCFTAEGGSTTSWKRLTENIGLLAVGMFPLIFGSGKLGVDALLERSSRD